MTTTTYSTGDTIPSTLTVNQGDTVIFADAASAGTSQINNAGVVEFEDSSTAGAAIVTTSNGGRTTFVGNSTAGSATLVAQSGGVVDFSGTSGASGDDKVSAGSLAGAGTFDLGAAQLTVGSNNASTTVSGIIADGGQSGGTGGSIVKTGTGTLTLSGNNTFSGGILVTGGTLSVAQDNSLGAAVGIVTLNGGTLSAVASSFNVKLSHGIVLGAQGGTLSATNKLGITGAISGSGGLTVTSGRIYLLGKDSYAGGTTINGGVLILGSNDGGSIGTGYGTVGATITGSITNNAGLNVLNADLSGVSSITTTDGATTVIAQALPSSLALTTTHGAEVDIYSNTISGPSTYTLGFGGPGTYVLESNVSVVIANPTDGTPINATIEGPEGGGTGLIAQSAGTTIFAGGSISAGLVIRSGVVQFGTTTQGNRTGTPNLLEAVSGLIDNYAELDVVNATSAGGSLISDGYGNNNGDLVTENGAQTNFYNNSDAADTVLDVESGGTVDFSRSLGENGTGVVQAAGLMGAGTVALGSDQIELNGFSSLALTFSGMLQDGGAAGGTSASVRLDTAATETFSGVNTYSGGTFLDGGTLSVASDASLGATSGAVTFDGGTLHVTSASFSSNRAFVLNAGGGTLDYDFNGTAVIAGISGVGTLTKTGAATAILENGTYAGGTINAMGLMQIGTTASGALTGTGGSTTTLIGAVMNEGTLDIVNANTSQLKSLTDNSASGINFYNNTSAGTAQLALGGQDFGLGIVNFYDHSTAGQSAINMTEEVVFHDNASAGQSQITLTGADEFGIQTDLRFFDASDAGSATIIDYTASSYGPNGEREAILFAGHSSAGQATIYDEGPSTIEFIDNSTASNSTIIADYGIIAFNGSGPNGDNNNTVGSLASDNGTIELGSTRLTVGSNNKSTTLNGKITGSGSLVKVGTGTLTLASQAVFYVKQYSGGTTIQNGTIELASVDGAGAGDLTFAGSAGSVATLALTASVQPSAGGNFGNTIDNFGSYDVLDLEGLAYTASATATVVGNTLTVTAGSTTENFVLGGSQAPGYSVSRGVNGEVTVTAASFVAPTISGTHANATTSEAAVSPFAGVTIGDGNSGATDTLTITVVGAGGTLSGTGLSGGMNGVYTLTGTAAAITANLNALSFTPTAGQPGTTSSTTFTLSDTSSAFSTPATDSKTTVVDTHPAVAPTITLTSTAVASNQATQTITGTVVSGGGTVVGQIVTLTDNNNTLGTATVAPDGSFTTNVILPNQGANAIVATVTDSYGNVGTSAAVVDTLDSIAPTIAITSSTSATILNASNVANRTITGIVTSGGAALVTGQTVTLTDNGKVLGTATVAGNGLFSTNVVLPNQGANSIVATVTDSYGNSGTSGAFVDTLHSLAPTITLTSAAEASNQATQTITGTVVSGGGVVIGQTVTLTDNGKALGTATVGADGSFKTNVVLPNQGANSLVATVTDSYGMIGASAAVVDTLDTIAPTIKITSAAVAGNQATQTITGTVVSGGTAAVSNQTVTLTDNGVVLVTLAPIVTDANGNFSAKIILPNQGANSLVASVSDSYGNVGTSTAVVDTLDSIAPTIKITSSAVASNQAAQTITGTVISGGTASVTGQTVTLTDNGKALGTATVAANGSFTTNVVLPNQGANSIVASVSDSYGNVGTSAAVVDTLDTIAPTIKITSAVVAGNQATQTITGTVVSGGTALVAGQTVTLTDNGKALGTATVAANGSFTTNVVLPNLGANSIVATVTDSYGNKGTSAAVVDTFDPGPVAGTTSATVKLGSATNVTASILAAAKPGLKGDTLTITADNTAGTAGSVSLVNGQLVYTAAGSGLSHIPANGSQTDSFSYTISDQYGDKTTGTETITVTNPANVINGPFCGFTTIQGTAGADIINASGIFNTIYANGGNDVVNAGWGLATVYTGNGDVVTNLAGVLDSVTGGNGNNTISGSASGASILLGNGNNSVSTGGLFNAISVGAGLNTINAGSGFDTVVAGAGTDQIKLGGTGNSITLNGSTATVSGGQGNDTITVNGGHDVLTFAGSNSQANLNGVTTASIMDLGKALRVNVGSSTQTDTISGFGTSDPYGVIDFKNGAGGFTSTQAIVNALHSDGHGGTMLALGATGSIDLVGTAPNQLHASNFKIG